MFSVVLDMMSKVARTLLMDDYGAVQGEKGLPLAWAAAVMAGAAALLGMPSQGGAADQCYSYQYYCSSDAQCRSDICRDYGGASCSTVTCAPSTGVCYCWQ